ncbi:MlaD family protein [Conexibacter sp. DBS9H8]|uniref:MlaD family protein n=1 Tax=Conexibacter sp. DBS9H8 TaxID=2937801 RepID=UPI00200EB2E7|nr:MlaD family protein [Conexibacter sp. DBS9H8]
MSKHVHKRRRSDGKRMFSTGIAMIAVGAFGFYYAITHRLPFTSPGGRTVTAYFSEPNQIQAGVTPVRVDGYNVGTVSSVTAVDGGRYGRAKLLITNGSLVLHRDASAALQYRTLLGGNFVVNLDPGSPSAPTLADNTIPLAHTTVQVGFDDILGVFRHSERLATKVDLRQLAASMSGPQQRSLITVLAPSLAPVPAAFNALRGEQTNDLSTLVASAATTVSTLAADRQSLSALISGGDATVSAISDHATALASALQLAPGALDATVAASRSIEATVPPLQRLLTALIPGSRELAPSSDIARPAVISLRRVLNRLQPLLSSLRPAIRTLAQASGPGIGLVHGLAPTFTRLNQQLLPWLNSQDSTIKRPIYQLIGPFFSGLNSVASEYDGHTHLIHFPSPPGLNSFDFLPCTVFAPNPNPTQQSNCNALNTMLGDLLGAAPSSLTGARR